MDKATIKSDEKARLATKAVQVILSGNLLQTIPAVGKGKPQKMPSDEIIRCFAGSDAKAVAGIVIARAKATSDEGERLREAFDKDGVDLGEWEEWLSYVE